jgi:ubiquinone/menaquinone biosynthesis C-methylase UbiE
MCLTCTTQLNSESLAAFGGRFIEILNHGALAAMVSVGYRTGLFEAMRRAGPATSAEIAAEAKLNERYVREWLGAVTCGGLVECDAEGKIYHLPPAHEAMLTDAPGAENLAHISQFVTMMGFIEDRLIDCFHNGGGVPYSAYPRFHDVMAAESHQTVVDHLFQDILTLEESLIPALERGIDVLDVGCGRGRALLAMAARFPNSRFNGWDLSEETVQQANDDAHRLGLTNLTFAARDLSDFHLAAPSEAFDLVTAFDAIHDQARPDHVLAGIRRTLKPGGLFLMQDIGASSNVAENRQHPVGTLIYSISCSHCMTVSLAQGGLGVGAAWGEQLTLEFLHNAGFKKVERRTLEHDIQNYYYLVRP